MMMVDTNRTDIYTEIGNTDKPFKTLSAAIAAADVLNPTGTDPYTFVMMGCNINENIDFGGTNFNFITLATTCRTVFNGTLTIDDNPNLKQLIIRNLEFAQTVTITGDGTADQMNDLSFYNVSFADNLNINRVNSLALWDVYSSAAVNITNLNYLYVGGGQVTGDITIVADSTLPLPSSGMTPGVAIIFDLICNNLILTRGGTATYVLQPHNTRIGLNAGTYTIPNGFTVSAQASTFRGTWTNNGTLSLRNSSTDNALSGNQPTYTGIIGGIFTGIVSATNGVVSGSSQVLGGTGILSSSNETFEQFSSSIDVINTTQNSRLNQLSTYTGSNDTAQSVQDVRLNNIESLTASLDSTYEEKASSTHTLVSGSDQLTGSLVDLVSDQTISGTKTFNDIVVNGTGSFAYIQSTTGSSTNIGEAFIVLNENTPSSNFAGIKVIDSGSSFATSSFVYDGLNNQWVFQHEGSVDSGSAVAIFGPLSQDGLGTEQGLTENRIPKSVTNHGHHIGDSNISDNGTLITLNSNSQVNGNLVVNGSVSANNLVSGSSQISYPDLSNIPAGIVSGSSQVDVLSTTNIARLATTGSNIFVGDQTITGSLAINDVATNFIIEGNGFGETYLQSSTGNIILYPQGGDEHNVIVKETNLTVEGDIIVNNLYASNGVVSGSSQVDITLTTGTLDISSRTNLAVSDTTNVDMILTGDTLSANLKGGVVSGSSQIDLTATTNYTSGIKARLNAETVISGSSQVTLSSAVGYGSLLRSDADDTASGVITFSNATQSTTKTTGAVIVTGGVGIAKTLNVGEDVVAYASSDRRLKDYITPITNPLQKINQIGGYSFVWNENQNTYTGKDYGVIAQEIEEILPELVDTRENGYKAVKYDKLVSLLIEGIKELSSEVEELKRKLNT
jgi:hypothetical protein